MTKVSAWTSKRMCAHGWEIDVLHGSTRVYKRGPSCKMPFVAWRLVVRQS